MKKIAIKYRFILIILTGLALFVTLFFSVKYNWNVSYILKDIFYFPVHVIPNNKEICLSDREKELEKELQEMKGLLDIDNTLTEFDTINAVVINRNVSYWDSELIINRGSKDNVKEKMAVIDSNGLVGIIEKTSLTTSIVRLITSNSKNNKISIKLWGENDNSINKILEQDEDNTLFVSGIDNDFKFSIGDVITTSGLSDIYPAGIIIGKVKKIESDKFGLSKKAIVEHVGDLNNIRFVSVLVRRSQ